MSTIEYRPSPLVTTVRDFSMSSGLDASTVTPGSTAPEASRTAPAIVLCARTVAGARAIDTAARQNRSERFRDVLAINALLPKVDMRRRKISVRRYPTDR